MGRRCLDKLQDNILVGCERPTHGIPEIYLMHIEDVRLTFLDGGALISAIDFAEGTKAYKVEGYKQNIQVTTALRSTDSSARFDVSIMFKSQFISTIARPIMTGKFYVMVVQPLSAGANFVWGCNCPLECSNVEYDSNANGKLITYTLTAPEGSAGNNPILTLPVVSESIIAKSV